MITVITGTPGAGKTLYTIEKLLLPLVGKTVKVGMLMAMRSSTRAPSIQTSMACKLTMS